MHTLPPGLQPQTLPAQELRQQSASAAQLPPWPAQHLVPAQTVLQHWTFALQVAFVPLQVQLLFRHWPLQQSPGAPQACW